MTKFMYIYSGGTEAQSSMRPEDMESMMKEWMAWGEKMGTKLLDFGSPVGQGTTVSASGEEKPSAGDVTGYSIIEAESLAAAVAESKTHPHLRTSSGCSISVHEIYPAPGM